MQVVQVVVSSHVATLFELNHLIGTTERVDVPSARALVSFGITLVRHGNLSKTGGVNARNTPTAADFGHLHPTDSLHRIFDRMHQPVDHVLPGYQAEPLRGYASVGKRLASQYMGISK